MAQKEKILDKAQKFLQKGQTDKALAEYRAAFDLDPRDISIRLRIGDLYVKMGKNPEAIKEYNEVAKANAQRGFYLKAIAVYKQVLKLDETSLEVHNKLAELYVKQRLIADAISEYSYIVSVLERKGRTSDVMDLLKKMVETDPENIGVRMKLADLFLKLSFEKDALAEYTGICEKLVAQGKPDKAEKVYLNLYNSGRKDVQVLKGLSEIYKSRAEQAQFLKFSRQLFDTYIEKADTESAKEMAYAILEAYPEDKESIKYLEQFVPKMPEAAGHEETRKEAAPPEEEKVIEPSPAPKEAEPVIEVPEETAPSIEETGPREQAEEKPAAIKTPSEKPEWEEEIEITLEGFEDESVAASPGEEAQNAEPVEAQEEHVQEAPVAGVPTGDEAVAPAAEAEVNIEIPGEEGLPLVPAAESPEIPAEEAQDQIELSVEAGASEEASVEVSVPVEEPPAPTEEAATPQIEEPAEPVAKEEEPLIAAPPELEAAAEGPALEQAQEKIEAVVEESAVSEGAPAEIGEGAAPSGPLEEGVLIDIPGEMESLKEEPPAKPGPAEGVLDEALREAVEAIEAIEEKAQKEDEAAKEAEPLIEEPVFVEEAEAQATEVQAVEEQTREVPAAPEEPAAEAPVAEERPAALEQAAAEEIPDERPAIDETRVETGPPPVEETLKEELPPAPAQTAEAEARAEDEISEAITELLEKMEPSEQMIEGERAAVEGDSRPTQAEEYVDLTAELGMEEAAQDKAETWGREEPKETFDEFRSGIGKQLSKEDTETHYNLGIAYMEMELHNEASKEFKIALKDPRLEFECYIRLGLCAMAENNPDEAIVYYLKGLKIENRSNDERKGMMYELALAYEAAGNMDEATQIFSFIQSMDPKFRDVSKKVRYYGERRPLIPLDDGLIEVELL